MPIAVYMLGLAVFAQGTSEFMLSGLVPGIARDLHVSVSAAGALTSAFAVGMIVGAPLTAVLGIRWPRRRALLVFLIAFMIVHVVGAITTSFAVLLAARVAGALANAGFLAVGLATATALAGPAAKGRAASVLLGGITLACVAGVPAGAVLGQLWGWRSAFWAVALVSVPAVVAVARSVPATPPGAAAPDARRELRALRRPRLLVVLLLGALVNGATFCTFTYLAPVITDVAGYGRHWVPVLLALFGLGSFAGVSIGGRMADTRPMRLLLPGGLALLAGWVLFGAAAGDTAAVFVLVFTQGTLSFAVGSTLITRALYAASDAPSLGGSFATAALNVGATAGPLLGGAAIDAGLGYRGPLWVSALLVALAFAAAAPAFPALAARRAGEPGTAAEAARNDDDREDGPVRST
ncbi:putative chloramphenicol resistance protein [Microbispora rosea subsp. aerata]|nr:Cmx/CmrA family chloramphenicol efflux MFS transporter [Microbispora rosea]GGO23092.1 putative chloramphenicol resistance protein [Microbispora rosea subsp. aerata]GIH57710.1 putative chloramphenicol resistance protein [Microbispora rosea subsp. aerata]GLJ84077.1 putative chloramphenicol resistance protein [Microbispora rosea subsp. aerata]